MQFVAQTAAPHQRKWVMSRGEFFERDGRTFLAFNRSHHPPGFDRIQGLALPGRKAAPLCSAAPLCGASSSRLMCEVPYIVDFKTDKAEANLFIAGTDPDQPFCVNRDATACVFVHHGYVRYKSMPFRAFLYPQPYGPQAVALQNIRSATAFALSPNNNWVAIACTVRVEGADTHAIEVRDLSTKMLVSLLYPSRFAAAEDGDAAVSDAIGDASGPCEHDTDSKVFLLHFVDDDTLVYTCRNNRLLRVVSWRTGHMLFCNSLPGRTLFAREDETIRSNLRRNSYAHLARYSVHARFDDAIRKEHPHIANELGYHYTPKWIRNNAVAIGMVAPQVCRVVLADRSVWKIPIVPDLKWSMRTHKIFCQVNPYFAHAVQFIHIMTQLGLITNVEVATYACELLTGRFFNAVRPRHAGEHYNVNGDICACGAPM